LSAVIAMPEAMEIHEAGLSMNLAELMFETRVGANMTQAQLAAELGAGQSAVAAWESGAEVPRVDVLERMAQICGKRLHISIDVD